MTADVIESAYDDAPAMGVSDYLAILKRRIWYIIIPSVVMAIAVVGIALVWPATYRSEAIILIEQPAVPPELVASTVTGYAEERVQIIKQRVLATENLVEIINKHDLYQRERKFQSLHSVVEKMRDHISLELISAGQNRRAQTTIAFTLAFENRKPLVAQRVTNDLVSLFLSENLRTRRERASETARFLAAEAERLESVISEVEGKLADLKQTHAGSLPEQLKHNLDLVARAESEVRDLDQREHIIKERLIYLDSELVQISPDTGGSATAGITSPQQEQLEALRTEFIKASARYGPEHPDVVNLSRLIAALESEAKRISDTSREDASRIEEERNLVRTELAQASEKYGAEHPDVVELNRQLAVLEAAVDSSESPSDSAVNGEGFANRAVAELQRQKQTADIELNAIERRRQILKGTIAEYEEKIEQIPQVERQVRQLVREYTDAQQQYQNIKAKQITAQLGETLEDERKGERFSLIEPPTLPDMPDSPNRAMILGVGLVLSAGAGLGTALLREVLDPSVHGVRSVVLLTGTAPLVVVPYIQTRNEIWRRRLWRSAYVFCGIAMISGAIAFIHYKVIPLDVLEVRVERQIQRNLPWLASPLE